MRKKLLIVTLFAVLTPLNILYAKEAVENFSVPDVKNNFCGVYINFQYCKCAFHNEYCEAVNYTPSSANSYVYAEYIKWLEPQIEAFARSCLAKGGIWNRPTQSCVYCEQGYVKENGRCAQEGSFESTEEAYNLPKPNIPVPIKHRQMGSVYSADGEVFLYSAAFQKWIGPINSGQGIYNGDLLITKDRGEAQIILYSKAGQDTIDIAPATRFEIADPYAPQGTWYSTLKNGAIHVYELITGEYVPPPDTETFNFRTPTIVTGHRGTELVLTHNEKTGESTLDLLEGRIDAMLVGNEKSNINLAPNMKIIASGNKISTSEFKEDEWKTLLSDNKLSLEKISIPAQDLAGVTNPPIDPDAVEPAEAVNDLVGDLSHIKIPGSGGGPLNTFTIIILIAGGVIAGFLYYRKHRTAKSNTEGAAR